jgi:Ca2+-binding RTX toxin-like protein
MRRAWIATAVSAGLLATAPGAGAATATYTERWDKYGPKGTVTVAAAPGERNDILVQTTPAATRITDSVPLTAGQGCAPQADGSVSCPPPYGIGVEAGDLGDRVRVEDGNALLLGGAGDDELVVAGDFGASLDGGPGDDRLVGGSASAFFLEGAAANGGDVMEGDARDTVVYTKRSRPVRADLDSAADDGERGERDRIGAGVGTVLGGRASDVLVGNSLPNTLYGGRGADVLSGRGGADRLEGGPHLFARRGSDERIYGGAGDDFLGGSGGDDLLRGGRGNDELRAGNGRDLLVPGPGADRAFAGAANDLIRARDGAADEIDCGGGWDRLTNDPLDWESRPGCERHDPIKP